MGLTSNRVSDTILDMSRNIPFAVGAFDKKSIYYVLRVAWWLKDSDPLTAGITAEAAVSMAGVGYGLGLLTLSTATRIRLFAEALGAQRH